MLSKIFKKLPLIIVLLFAVLQVIPNNRPVNKEAEETDFLAVENIDSNVEITIKKACYDCHSNQTKHPWYSSIAPISWWINDHVEHGRKHLNFSDWGTYSKEKKDHKIEECIEMIEEEEMPLFSYQLAHSEARLSDKEIQELLTFFNAYLN